MDAGPLQICKLGEVPYRDALALQRSLMQRRIDGELGDVMLLLEHPPTYTRGRRSGPGELPLGEDAYSERGIEIVDVDRGGKVTYHGPGQLVGYPIVRTTDVVAHLRTLERGLVAALADEGVRARSRGDEGPDFTGVWVQDRKIASIGVHVSHGVTTHGFAINVVNEMAPWEWIVPCGLEGVAMTSLARELGAGDGALSERFRARAAARVAEAFGRRPLLVGAAELGIAPAAAAA